MDNYVAQHEKTYLNSKLHGQKYTKWLDKLNKDKINRKGWQTENMNSRGYAVY